MSDVLSCRNLGKTFTQGADVVKVLEKINLSVPLGERVAIVDAPCVAKATTRNAMDLMPSMRALLAA